MKTSVIFKHILPILVLAAFSQGANALSFGGSGTSTSCTCTSTSTSCSNFKTLYCTNGIRAESTLSGLSNPSISDGSTAVLIEISNVTSAVFFCTNQPGNTPKGTSSTQFVEFPPSLQTSNQGRCSKKEQGKCNFTNDINATQLIGLPNDACPGNTWTVTDVVGGEYDATARGFKCVDSANHSIACDANRDGILDANVIIKDEIREDQHCVLPNPETLKWGEVRQFDCTLTPQ